MIPTTFPERDPTKHQDRDREPSDGANDLQPTPHGRDPSARQIDRRRLSRPTTHRPGEASCKGLSGATTAGNTEPSPPTAALRAARPRSPRSAREKRMRGAPSSRKASLTMAPVRGRARRSGRSAGSSRQGPEGSCPMRGARYSLSRRRASLSSAPLAQSRRLQPTAAVAMPAIPSGMEPPLRIPSTSKAPPDPASTIPTTCAIRTQFIATSLGGRMLTEGEGGSDGRPPRAAGQAARPVKEKSGPAFTC